MNLTAPLTDKANALEALVYCNTAYNMPTLSTPLAHVFILQLTDHIVVACRGSDSPEDWMDDLEFQYSSTIYGGIHDGFWTSTNTILPAIHGYLQKLPKLPILVMGHSLGGAQAEITAVDLVMSMFPVKGVITFGGPRVGDGDWKVFYETPRNGVDLKALTARWVNGRDIVPRLPFTSDGYVHVGHELFLPSTSTAVDMDPTGWELTHDDVIGILADISARKVNAIANHQLQEYRDRIMQLTG